MFLILVMVNIVSVFLHYKSRFRVRKGHKTGYFLWALRRTEVFSQGEDTQAEGEIKDGNGVFSEDEAWRISLIYTVKSPGS